MTKGELRAQRKAERAVLLDKKIIKPRKRRVNYDEAMYRWAKRYDSLNGAPENDDDR